MAQWDRGDALARLAIAVVVAGLIVAFGVVTIGNLIAANHGVQF